MYTTPALRLLGLAHVYYVILYVQGTVFRTVRSTVVFTHFVIINFYVGTVDKSVNEEILIFGPDPFKFYT